MRWLLILTLCGCDGVQAPVPFEPNCTVGAAPEESKVTAGRKSDGSVILPGGRKLTPSGRVLMIGGFPLNLRVLPGDRYVVVTDGAEELERLKIVDLEAADAARPVVSAIDYPNSTGRPNAPALFYGLALNQAGTKLYVSNGGHDGGNFNVIQVFSVAGNPPSLSAIAAEEIHLPYLKGSARYPAGLQLSADEQTLYTVNQIDGTLSVIDVRPGAGYGLELGVSPELGLVPYDLLVDSAAKLAYVSLWGGRNTGGTDFLEGVVTVDLSQPAMPMPVGALIPTGKAATALIVAGSTIYVTAADGDSISAIDPVSRMSAATPTAIDSSGLTGSAPNALAVDGNNNRLYVANAGENAVQAFSLPTMQPLGRLPTCWYPTTVAVLGSGNLVIGCAKGLGGGANDHPPTDYERLAGALDVVPLPSLNDLKAGDQAVRDNLKRPLAYEPPLSCTDTPKKFALPAERGAAGPIEHVFLIVKENKTYDSILGDLPGTNGKPDLAIFGGDMTPNTHALAKRFANLDNFYSNAEESLQGHHWTTAGTLNNYGEKAWVTTAGWGRGTRPVTAFGNTGGSADHLTTPASKPIWQLLDAAGLSYHNYGEVVNVGGAKTQYDVNYPGIYFAMLLTDVTKMSYVLENLNDPTTPLERFVSIGLPNDHTFGTDPGKPTPQSMIADNDEALGQLIDSLSHSKYWPTSIVFVIEDDPSGAADHVEFHRSICLVISPWVKRGALSSVNYDNPSMWKTITLLLGTPPMNLNDANAAAMYDLFATTPDLEPYTHIPRKIPVGTNSLDAPLAAESRRIDFSQPDTADLGRILWKAMKGKESEPPWGNHPVRIRDDDD